MSGPPRWPKGPFPEKFRAPAVLERLAHAWDGEAPRAAKAAAIAAGWRPHPRHEDAFVLLLVGGPPASDAALAAMDGVTFVPWVCGAKDDVVVPSDGPLRVLLPTPDAIEAAMLVGTSGPRHGIGSAAIARFLVTLRSFARTSLVALGEEHLAMTITPRDEASAHLIAERMTHVCPPLARAHATPAPIAAELMAGRFVMDWS